MNSDQAFIFAVIIAALLLFIWGRWRYDLVAMLVLIAAAASGVVPWNTAFSGFAHPAVVTVAAVLILSRSLLNSGMVEVLARWLSRAGSSPSSQVASLTGLAALLSGFMNNVGALALLMPVGILMARRGGNQPSIMLMPLAFGTLLGGMITLIGTPPNIIISAFRAEKLGEPFGMFDFTPAGIGVAMAGLIFISLIGWRLTPVRTGPQPSEEIFKVENYHTEVRVPEGSVMVGRSLSNLISAARSNIQFLELIRGELCLPSPTGEEVLRPGDILVVRTNIYYLNDLLKSARLDLVGVKDLGEKVTEGVGLMEAVVMNDSLLVDKAAGGLCMRQHYGINLIAVARRGADHTKRLSQISFQPGDVLLLQGHLESLPGVLELLGCLPLAQRGLRLGQEKNIILPLLIFILAIAGTASGILPMEMAFAGAATATVISGMLTLQEAYQSVDWSIVVLLGAMVPVSQALESTGGAELITSALLQVFDDLPAAALLAALMILTMILTNVVNNAAAAVLMAPIVLNAALDTGSSPDPFLMAVAIGSSCAFLTPIGHQSNTLVMGPGGYTFADYWHIGLPLSVIVVLVAVPLILLLWPL